MIQVPPHNLEAEKAILGSIFLENDLLYSAMQRIDENYFYNMFNKKLFKLFKWLKENDRNIEVLSVLTILDKKNKDCDNDSYIKSLYEFAVTTASFENYIDILIENKKLRDLLDLSIKIQDNIAENVESENILSFISQNINNDIQDTEILDAQKISELVLENFQKDKKTFLETGISKIDAEFQGINTSGLMTIAGLTGFGKTTLALNIAEHHIRQYKNVLIFQMEMESEEMLQKMIANKVRISTGKLKNKYMNREEKERYFLEVAEFSKFNYKICDRGSLTIEKIVSIIKTEHKKKNLDLIVIDYLGLINTSNIKANSLAEKTGYITKTLKALSRDLKTHMILLAQLNRDVSKQNRYPKLSDLKESSSIEQDSDIVMFTHYDDKLKENKIIIAKNRHGECRTIDIYFDMPHSIFN